jgi:divalent metal cation (Fe/Co/Zn/Cd) transporter
MIRSGLLKAVAVDARNDVVVTAVTIVSITLNYFSGMEINGYMGLLCFVFVLYSGFLIAKETLLRSFRRGVSRNRMKEITGIVENYDGILGSHDLVMHNYGPSHVMGTVHVEVSNDFFFGRSARYRR